MERNKQQKEKSNFKWDLIEHKVDCLLNKQAVEEISLDVMAVREKKIC